MSDCTNRICTGEACCESKCCHLACPPAHLPGVISHRQGPVPKVCRSAPSQIHIWKTCVHSAVCRSETHLSAGGRGSPGSRAGCHILVCGQLLPQGGLQRSAGTEASAEVPAETCPDSADAGSNTRCNCCSRVSAPALHWSAPHASATLSLPPQCSPVGVQQGQSGLP